MHTGLKEATGLALWYVTSVAKKNNLKCLSAEHNYFAMDFVCKIYGH